MHMSGCMVFWRMKATQIMRQRNQHPQVWLHCSERPTKTSWCSVADCFSWSITCTPCACAFLSVLLSRAVSTARPAGVHAMRKLLIRAPFDVTLWFNRISCLEGPKLTIWCIAGGDTARSSQCSSVLSDAESKKCLFVAIACSWSSKSGSTRRQAKGERVLLVLPQNSIYAQSSTQ